MISIIKRVLATVLSIIGVIMLSSDGFALSADGVYKELLANSMQHCYDSSQMNDTVSLKDYSSFGNSILKNGRKQDLFFIPTGVGVGNSLSIKEDRGTKIGCYELFEGDPTGLGTYGGKMESIFKVFEKSAPASDADSTDVFNGLGYTETIATGGTAQCIKATYTYDNSIVGEPYAGGSTDLNKGTIGSICWDENDLNDGKVLFGQADSYGQVSLVDNPLNLYMNNDVIDKIEIGGLVSTHASYTGVTSGSVSKEYDDNGFFTVNMLKSLDKAVIQLSGYNYNENSKETILTSVTVTLSVYEAGTDSGEFATLGMKSYPDAYKDARKYFTGNSEIKEFSVEDKYNLYSAYLSNVYGAANVSGQECKKDKTELGGSPVVGSGDNVKYYFYMSKSNGWCRIQVPSGNLKKQVSVFGNSNTELTGSCDFECFLKEAYSLDLDGVDVSTDVANDPTSRDEEEEDNCRNSEGAKSLGWILCPILSFLGDASEKVYIDYVEPALRIDARLFSDQSEVVDAWSVFRNIANIIFIILLLVVIFSQLTGVGIDNYGIKKILPRLIVAAIMINLSYLICVLLVDISNIMGNGLQAIFNGLGSSLSPSIDLSSEGVTSMPSIDFTGPLVSVGVLAALVVMAGAIWTNPSIILSLLVGALGIVVSIFFLFLLLAAREAAIIVLVVLSPIAVVLYMLPNTKKLFDKWLKFFEGLLLVYPIAGLLVGGGNYVSKLLMSMPEKGFFSTLIGMVIGVIPIFFIPMVLKGSFSAMGKVGGMLTSLGDSAKKRTTGAVRGTEAYKNAQRMGLERRTRLRSGLDRDGNLTARGNRRLKMLNKLAAAPVIGGVARGAVKNQAALMSQAKKNIGASEAAMGELSGALARSEISKTKEMPLSDGGSLTQEGSYYAQKFMDAASRNDITGMNAAIEAMRNSNMKAKDISRVIRHAQNSGKFSGLASDKKSAWFRDLSKKYGNDFLSTDYELSHFMRTGGSLTNGELGQYGEYAATAPIDADEIRPDDITKLSGDSLAAMATAGKISAGMAQRIMESNPNISEDKKIMLGAIAEGKVGKMGTGNDSVKAFKEDAKSLMSGGEARNKTFSDVTKEDVMRWSSATPQAVKVVNGGVPGKGTGGGTGGGAGGSGTSGTPSTPTPIPVPASGPTVIPEGYAEYDNISGRSSMILREMPDGTLQDSSGNTYSAARWKRAGSVGDGSSSNPSSSVPEGYAEYDNISGRSSMILREMPDGTLQDSSGNTYSAARWKRAGRVESGADSSRPQPQRQTQPQPRPQSQPIQIQNTGAGGMPQTRSGIVLPGDTSQISKLAEQARKSNNNNNGQ